MSDSIEVGTGNVFADLGIPNPDEHQIKADLALAIKHRIDAKGLTQAQAAALMDETQPNVSAIVRGRLRAFSLERLMHHLNALGFDVEVMIRETPAQQRGRLMVRTVAPSASPKAV